MSTVCRAMSAKSREGGRLWERRMPATLALGRLGIGAIVRDGEIELAKAAVVDVEGIGLKLVHVDEAFLGDRGPGARTGEVDAARKGCVQEVAVI